MLILKREIYTQNYSLSSFEGQVGKARKQNSHGLKYKPWLLLIFRIINWLP